MEAESVDRTLPLRKWIQAESVGLLVALLLGACTSSALPETTGDSWPQITVEEFRETVKTDAGETAADCGALPLGADRGEVHCCLIAAFEQSSPAYATYEEQGVDGRVITGVSTDEEAEVTTFTYDDNYTGNLDDRQVHVSQEECDGAIAKPNACSTRDGIPFQCLPKP